MDEKPDILKRVIGLKQIDFLDNGEIKIMGISGILMPIVSFSLLNKVMIEKLGYEKANSLFYFVGENQGIQAVDLLVKKYGMSNEPKKVIEMILGQGPMMGFGKAEIIRFDINSKQILISFTTSPVASIYKSLFGRQEFPIDVSWRSIIGGAAKELFKTDIVAVERECICMGKEKCIIEIKERKYFENEKEYIKKQIPLPEFKPNEIELKKWFSKGG